MPKTVQGLSSEESVCVELTSFSQTSSLASCLQPCEIPISSFSMLLQCLLGMSEDVDFLLPPGNSILICTLVTWAVFWNNRSTNTKRWPRKNRLPGSAGESDCMTSQQKTLCSQPLACCAYGNPRGEVQKCGNATCISLYATAQALL